MTSLLHILLIDNRGAVILNDVIVIVDENAKRLAEDERRPDDCVAPPFSHVLLQILGDDGERKLSHHTHESPNFEGFQRHRDQVFVEEGADEEDDEGCDRFAVSHVKYWQVQMPHAPPMNRHVPRSPEGVDVIRVPPVAVKVSISELKNFSEKVQEGMEHQVEEAQPDEVIWNL